MCSLLLFYGVVGTRKKKIKKNNKCGTLHVVADKKNKK